LDEALDRGIGSGLGCSDAGALPMHASLEKNPRLTPLRIGRSDASGNSTFECLPSVSRRDAALKILCIMIWRA